MLDAILYEVHTPVRRRGADDDAPRHQPRRSGRIVIEDLAFSELVSDRAFRLILGALLLCRYGEVVLNLERKTEEIT